MATFVQNTGTNTASNTANVPITSAFASNVTKDSLIVVAVFIASGSAVTITDSLNNKYTIIESIYWGGSGSYSINVAYAISAGGACTVSAVSTAGAVSFMFLANEYSDIDTELWKKAYDNKIRAGNVGAGTPSSGTSVVTKYPNELIIGVAAQGGAATAQTLGSGYGNLYEQTNAGGSLAIEDKTVSTVGTQSATFGTSYTNWSCGAYMFVDKNNPRTIIQTSKLRPAIFTPGLAR